MSYKLKKYSFEELKKMAKEMELENRKTKKELILSIENAFKEYEKYKQEKKDKYKIHHQIGEKGKEGSTYLVTDKKGREYAMKTFSKTKSSNRLKKEYDLQKKAAKRGVAPKVYDYDTIAKRIIMEKMDGHFFENRSNVTVQQQKRIIEIYKELDNALVFHGDPNLMNYMVKNKQIFLIDYGLSKDINEKLLKSIKTKTPNYTLMTIGIILKLKEFGFPFTSYSYFLKHVSEENKKKYLL